MSREVCTQPPSAKPHVGLYYCLALGISWAGWVPYAAQQAGVVHWSWRISGLVPVLAQYGPALAALLVVAFESGSGGVAQLLRDRFHMRFGLQWLAIPVLLPPVIAAVLIGIHCLRGTPAPSLASMAGWQVRFAAYINSAFSSSPGTTNLLSRMAWKGSWQAAFLFFGLAIANGGLSEELGWRGFALARLCPGRRAFVAALWVGVLWGFWHTGPQFWTAIFKSHWGALAIPFAYLTGTVPLSIMFAWVFIRAEGSVVPTILFHASHNATLTFLTALWLPGKSAVSLPEWLAATLVASVLVVVLDRQLLLGNKASIGPTVAAYTPVVAA